MPCVLIWEGGTSLFVVAMGAVGPISSDSGMLDFLVALLLRHRTLPRLDIVVESSGFSRYR